MKNNKLLTTGEFVVPGESLISTTILTVYSLRIVVMAEFQK